MTSISGAQTWRTHFLATALAALVPVGCSAEGFPPRERVPDAPLSRVLFQGVGRNHLLIGMARLDGSDVTYPLDDLPGGDQMNPDWSPDGSQIVLVVNDGVRDDLWIAEADGTGARVLLDCERACRHLDDPSWSPDGSSVVYSRTVARGLTGWGSLERVDVADGEVSVILPPRLRTFTAGARWSPDGLHLVFESAQKAGPGLEAEVDGVSLRVVELASGKVGPALTEPSFFAATADWSPDGDQIVYSGLVSSDSEAPDLFVMLAGGGEPRRLTRLADAGGFAQEPDWQDDGDSIVFSGRLADRAGSAVLLEVSADGGTPADVGSRAVIGRHPRVEPGA